MRPVIAVVRLVLRLWRNDLRRMLGGSTLNTQLLLWCAAAVMVAWEVFGSSWLLGSSRDTLQQIGRSRDAAQLATLTVTCMAASFASPLLLITPAATALEHLLAPMPLSRFQRRLVAELPVQLLTLAAALLSVGPLVLPALSVGGWSLATARAATVLVLLAAAGVATAGVAFRALSSLCARVLRLPSVLAQTLSAGVVTLAAAALLIHGYSRIPFGGSWLGRLLAQLFDMAVAGLAGFAVGVLLVGAVTAAVGCALWWLAELELVREPVVGVHLGLRLPLRPRGRTLPYSVELRQWLRFPMNASTVLLQLSLLVVLAVVGGRSGNTTWWPTVPALFFWLASLVGTTAYGVTRRHHWLYRVMGRGVGTWLPPKLAASLSVWAGLLAVELLVSATLGGLSPGFLRSLVLLLLPQLLVVFAAGSLIGLVLPVDNEQAISNTLADLTAAIVSLLVLVLLGRLGAFGSPGRGSLVAGAVVAVAFALYGPLVRWRERELAV